MKFLSLMLLLICTFSFAAKTSEFTDTELEQSSPFDVSIQKRTLKEVLKYMHVKPPYNQPLPKILISESITKESQEIVKAAASQGMPLWALKKGVNLYLIDLNIILLGRDKKIHNLAHEYVHYVQVIYRGYTREDFQFDEAEESAVWIQNNFRD